MTDTQLNTLLEKISTIQKDQDNELTKLKSLTQPSTIVNCKLKSHQVLQTIFSFLYY